jgi:hypothetical protein
MIPTKQPFAQKPVLTLSPPTHFQHDPVVQKYARLFAPLDALLNAESKPSKRHGRLPHPATAYLKAFMVLLLEGQKYLTQLAQYLREHPALVAFLGFGLTPDANSPHGFDVARSVPCARHLRRKYKTTDLVWLNQLLSHTVQSAKRLAPELQQVLAVDVKHQYAPVQENNPKAYVKQRFDPTKQPKGDPEARLGVKRRHNQVAGQVAQAGQVEYVWGYGTGIAVAQTKTKLTFVIADLTQPFNQTDVTYGLPLQTLAERNFGAPFLHFTADAAFDSSDLYEGRPPGGIAAIPLNLRGQGKTRLSAQGVPLCDCNDQPMRWVRRTKKLHQQVNFFVCGACHHKRQMLDREGNRLRLLLDRKSALYQQVYRHRTAAERVNSQATALGIECPQQRGLASVSVRNRLTYLVLNLLQLHRLIDLTKLP